MNANEQLKQTLAGLSAVTKFFKVSPEFEKVLGALQVEITKYEKLVGIYTTVQKVEKALSDTGKRLSEAESMKNKAKRDAASAASLLNDRKNAVEKEVGVATEKRSAELADKAQVLEDGLTDLAGDQAEVSAHLGKLRREHSLREESLDKREEGIAQKETDLQSDKQRVAIERKSLQETREKIANMV